MQFTRFHTTLVDTALARTSLVRTSLVYMTLAWLLIFSAGVHASQAGLDRFFAEVETLRAKFSQRVADENGMLLEESDGEFYLSRPGQFRWDYNSTDPELPMGQQIIADGSYIYLYDPELEQLTQRGLKDALGQVPSLLLVQSGANIEQHFQIADYGLTDGLSWVALKPRDEDAGYQQLMIGFKQNTIEQILLLDGLGNETRLQLSQVEENVQLSDRQFVLEPPEGTDILFQ